MNQFSIWNRFIDWKIPSEYESIYRFYYYYYMTIHIGGSGIFKFLSKYLHCNPIIFVAKSGIGWDKSQKIFYATFLIDWNQNFSFFA